jgi:hypothetical protein
MTLAEWLEYAQGLLINEGTSSTLPAKLMALGVGIVSAAIFGVVVTSTAWVIEQLRSTPRNSDSELPAPPVDAR